MEKIKPGIATAAEEKEHERWWSPKTPSLLTTHDKKKTIKGCIMQQLVKFLFNHHYYMWEK